MIRDTYRGTHTHLNPAHALECTGFESFLFNFFFLKSAVDLKWKRTVFYVHCKLVKRNLLFKNCAKIVNLYNRALDEATINSSSPIITLLCQL